MLDRTSIERLSKTPEKNAPMLNVALAEEGDAAVLVALARSAAVGPEALAAIGARIDQQGEAVGQAPDWHADEVPSVLPELDRLLVLHARSPDAVRDAVLRRRPGDAFFTLAAAAHPRATLEAAVLAARWPSSSAVHDRLWLALVEPSSVPPLVLEEWAADESELMREAAARISRDEALLARLGKDPSRRVRRAVASNRFAGELRADLAQNDPAAEVRARAGGSLTAHGDMASEATSVADTARFAAALRAMTSGGVLAPDVTRALSATADLDPEGARLAAEVLPRGDLGVVVERLVTHDARCAAAMGLALGLGLRAPMLDGDADETDHTEIVYDAVKALSATTTADTRLTGKARLAAWMSEAVGGSSAALDVPAMLERLSRGPLAADRMVLARRIGRRMELVRSLCATARSPCALPVPGALLELAWEDPSIDDAALVELAARVRPPKKRAEDLPEDEVDLDPALRTLPTLEAVVLAAAARTNLTPRAALSAVALDARRVRYVLSAMPQWKGRLTGGRLARVLRQHAGALSAAQAEARARASKVEGWTERLMSELELGIALAVGHLTGAEVSRRIATARQAIDDGLSLVSGAEVRAVLEGPGSVAPLLDWAGKNRTTNAAALAVWLLLERYDRQRAPSLVASAVDAIASGATKGVPPSVCDALALMERRAPGRLEEVHPQSPRGRATLASAIAKAYRALGGLSHERAG